MPKSDYSNTLGRQFERLTVKAVIYPAQSGQKRTVFECECSCGKIKRIDAKSVLRGLTVSCGCLGRDRRLQANMRHGLSRTPEHKIWIRMNQRCQNSDDQSYSFYGGRGISVCKRWIGKSGFLNFLSDMGNRPSDTHSIDRIDNDGDYKPSNCRWATRVEQVRNRRNTRTVSVDGFTGTLLELAEWAHVPYDRLVGRYKRGMREQALIAKGDQRGVANRKRLASSRVGSLA